jgi:hypothetical protein
MKKAQRIFLGAAIILVLASLLLIIVWQPSMIRRVPYTAPELAYHSWDEILSHPQPITIRTYSTGMMQTNLSAIMNLEHELAQDVEDEDIEIPVNVGLVHHKDFGAFFFCSIDQNIISHQHRSASKSPETIDNARVAHIPDTLATLPAAFGLPVRF